VFVILGDVLELFVADGAVKRPKDLRYLSLESDATGNTSLWAVQMMSYKLYVNEKDETLASLALRCSSVSFRWRSESNSRRCETVVSIMRKS